MFERSGAQRMHCDGSMPMPLGATDIEPRMLPASSPMASLLGKFPPALPKKFDESMSQGWTTEVSIDAPAPALRMDSTLRAVMLQPFGLALHGAGSVRSSSARNPSEDWLP